MLGFCKSGHICTVNILVIHANQCNGLLCCDIALLCIKLLVTIIVIQLQQHTMDPLLGIVPVGHNTVHVQKIIFHVLSL